MKQITTTILLGILWTGLLPAGALRASTQLSDALPAASGDTANIQAYRAMLENIESRVGAYAPELAENLLSLGEALQNEGRHDEALRIFKRGAHLARINNGLYSAAQIPMIQGEISSHIAKRSFLEADQRQNYLYKVQQRSLNSPGSLTQAFMQQADWQYRAYLLGIGEERYSRLMNMWDLYRGALTDIATREGETSTNLLPPLRGLLQTQYLIASHRAESDSGSFNADAGFGARQQQNRFNAYRAKSYTQGRAVIKAIYDIERSQTDQQFLAAAEALVMMGDWMQWHGEQEAAQQAYREAIGELVELDDAQVQMSRLFGQPVPLPAISGLSSLPGAVPPEDGDLLVEFDVTAQGRVKNLSRVDENDEIDGAANRMLRRLRATIFRPRFENSEAVNTENISNAYRIADS